MPLTLTKWWAPAGASKWRMGFNSAFKGLRMITRAFTLTFYVIMPFKD
jgi:hypothetical protein